MTPEQINALSVMVFNLKAAESDLAAAREAKDAIPFHWDDQRPSTLAARKKCDNLAGECMRTEATIIKTLKSYFP